jgi:hypothetical protein
MSFPFIGKYVEGSSSDLIYGIFSAFGRAEKNHENLSQDSQSLGRDFNLGPPKYEASMLTTQSCLFNVGYCAWQKHTKVLQPD